MAVEPQVQVVLDQLAAAGGPALADLSPTEARQLYKMMGALDGGPEPVPDVRDDLLAGPAGPVPVRVYRPEHAPTGLFVWFHGGGWVIGDLDTADAQCRRIVNRSGAVVVSVDYRLAPEHRYPAAAADCWAAVGWAHASFPALAVAVGGDSAGGNLAAVVAQRAAAAGLALALQVLVYPVTDCTLSSASMDENGEGYFLTKATMGWFVDCYLGEDGDPKDPGASPLHAGDVRGVCRALIITAEYDPLRDEGEAYAQRLRVAGVAVELTRYDGLVHGFFAMGAVTPKADEAAQQVGKALRAAFQGA
jgi:acetyl esterase